MWWHFKSGGHEDLDEKVTFEQSPDGGKGAWPCRYLSRCKGPGVGVWHFPGRQGCECGWSRVSQLEGGWQELRSVESVGGPDGAGPCRNFGFDSEGKGTCARADRRNWQPQSPKHLPPSFPPS